MNFWRNFFKGCFNFDEIKATFKEVSYKTDDNSFPTPSLQESEIMYHNMVF